MNGGMDEGGKEGRGKEGGSEARGVRERRLFILTVY